MLEFSTLTLSRTQEHVWVRDIASNKGDMKTHSIYSQYLGEERGFKVYTPYGYLDSDNNLSLIVMTDGEMYLDYLKADKVLDNLIYKGYLRRHIGVFIDSKESRGTDLRCNKKFTDFIAYELVPWIHNHYSVSSDPKNCIISGFSLGGLNAMFMGVNYSSVFGKVLSQSGSFWYSDDDGQDKTSENCWMSELFQSAEKKNLKIYMNVGVLEAKKPMIETNENLYEMIKSLGYEVNFEYFNSGHDYLSWGEYLARGLIALSKDVNVLSG